MTQFTWVLCPICGNKTRTKIRPDTEAKNLPILCRVCKNEVVVDIKDMRATKYERDRRIHENREQHTEKEV